jgi:hypothetical protein
MQKAAALLAIATVAMAGDKPTAPVTKEQDSTILRFKFDDANSRTIYQPELVDPMIIKPNVDIDPKMIIRPRYDYNIDPKMIIKPPTYPTYPKYYYADDEELNVVSKIKEDAKKAAEFVSEHPELVLKAIEIIKNLKHHDEELNFSGFIKKVGKEAKKGVEFVAEHPQIMTQASKFLAHDDDEYFNVQEGVEKAGKFIVEHPEVVKQVEQKVEEIINKYKGHKNLLKQDAKKSLDYVAQHPEVIKQVSQLVKNLAQHDDDELFAEPIYPIKQAPKKKFLAADDEDSELSVLGQMIREGVKNQNGPKASDFGRKKIVSFDEVSVEKMEYFEDNDLMCISLNFAGRPFQYCK